MHCRLSKPAPRLRVYALLSAAVTMAAGLAHADVVISNDPTQNMACTGGVCALTAPEAVINVNLLAADLAVGSVLVTTTGAGGVEATNIVLAAPPPVWAQDPNVNNGFPFLIDNPP